MLKSTSKRNPLAKNCNKNNLVTCHRSQRQPMWHQIKKTVSEKRQMNYQWSGQEEMAGQKKWAIQYDRQCVSFYYLKRFLIRVSNIRTIIFFSRRWFCGYECQAYIFDIYFTRLCVMYTQHRNAYCLNRIKTKKFSRYVYLCAQKYTHTHTTLTFFTVVFELENCQHKNTDLMNRLPVCEAAKKAHTASVVGGNPQKRTAIGSTRKKSTLTSSTM